jgi:hypothetical protein
MIEKSPFEMAQSSIFAGPFQDTKALLLGPSQHRTPAEWMDL